MFKPKYAEVNNTRITYLKTITFRHVIIWLSQESQGHVYKNHKTKTWEWCLTWSVIPTTKTSMPSCFVTFTSAIVLFTSKFGAPSVITKMTFLASIRDPSITCMTALKAAAKFLSGPVGTSWANLLISCVWLLKAVKPNAKLAVPLNWTTPTRAVVGLTSKRAITVWANWMIALGITFGFVVIRDESMMRISSIRSQQTKPITNHSKLSEQIHRHKDQSRRYL